MLNNQDGMAGPENEVIGLGSILILEDEVLVSIVLEEVVRGMGASEVVAIGDADSALHIAQTAKLDLAILDVHLGGSTSFAVADVLEARGIPFMFSTATDVVALEERHRHRPMLGKPFADEELRAHLINLVRR